MNTPTSKASATQDLSTLPPSAFSTPLSEKEASSLSPTTLSDSSFIEPRLRENRFRLFEANLLAFEKNNYEDLTIPVEGDPFTAANRCRDAIASVIQYRWLTAINIDALSALRKNISVRGNANGTITIGKSKRGNKAAPNVSEITIDCTDPQSLIAIGLLLSQKQISQTVKLINYSPDILEKVLKKFKLSFDLTTQTLCLAPHTSDSIEIK